MADKIQAGFHSATFDKDDHQMLDIRKLKGVICLNINTLFMKVRVVLDIKARKVSSPKPPLELHLSEIVREGSNRHKRWSW